MEIIHGTEENFNKLIEGEVLVDFYATWCGPCKMLGPVLEELKDEIQIVKVDVDENSNLARKYGVMSVPTLIHFKNKDDYKTSIGYLPKDEILNFIKKSD